MRKEKKEKKKNACQLVYCGIFFFFFWEGLPKNKHKHKKSSSGGHFTEHLLVLPSMILLLGWV